MYHHKNGVCLRKCERSDLPDLLALKNESWWGTHDSLIANSGDQERWFDESPANRLCMIAEETGYVMLSDINWIARTARLSGSVYKKMRSEETAKACGACYVDFAFEILNLHRLDVGAVECNYVARKIEVEYLGFKVEGRREDAVYKAGKYYDSLVLGLLRKDWARQERVLAYGGSCNMTFDHALAEKFIVRARREL